MTISEQDHDKKDLIVIDFDQNRTEELRPEIKKVSLTKTIRFNESERDLWDMWNKDLVKKIKAFIREQLTHQQILVNHLKKFVDPISEKRKLMKEKLELIRFMEKKHASPEKIDQLCREYNDIYYINL